MSEVRKDQLLPRPEFARRMLRSLAAGLVLLLFSLGLGILGYHYLAGLAWIDAFLDAAMILSGMGPMSPLHDDVAKVFAGCYAIYCGVALLGTTGIIFTPLIHRSLHRFHLEWDRKN